jgi:hypothetical protein
VNLHCYDGNKEEKKVQKIDEKNQENVSQDFFEALA